MTPDSADQEVQDLKRRPARKPIDRTAHRSKEDIAKCKQLQKREKRQNDALKQWSAVRVVVAEPDSEEKAERKAVIKVGKTHRKEQQMWDIRKEKEKLQAIRRLNAVNRDARLEQRRQARDKIAQRGAKVISEDEISAKEIPIPKGVKEVSKPKKLVIESEESSSCE